MNQKKIVISGYYGWDNIGDEAILEYIVQLLKTNDIEPIVITQNPEKVNRMHGVRTVKRDDFKSIRNILQESNGLISGGGSLIQDVTSKKSALYYLLVIALNSILLNKETYIYAQGIGPLHSKILRKFARQIFKQVKILSVRDKGSVLFLENVLKLKNKEIELMTDPVLFNQLDGDINLNFTDKELHFLDRQPVFISIKPSQFNEKSIKEFRQLVDYFQKNNTPVVAIPFHGNQDLEITKKVLHEFHDVHLFERELTMKEILTILQKSKMVIGMRLHSLIMAASMDTPFIGISYDPKIDAFMKQFDDESVCTIEDIKVEKIINKMHTIEENYEFIVKKNREIKQTLEKRNQEVNEQIIQRIRNQR